MWYLGSLAIVFLALGVLSAAGTAFADRCLPWRLRPVAREFLAPTLGLALFLVPINVLGWLGHGFTPWICLPLTLVLFALALAWVRVDRNLPRPLLRWRFAAFVLLASFPVLGQLLYYRTFNPFNDTWTYLYQAQWFQHHGFREPAQAAGHHPAALAVLGFQESGLRITPTLLLGWLQAVFGLDWSYEAYPATLALVLICAALAVGAIVRAACPARHNEAWWAALAAAVTFNGLATGAFSGFFPQTLGLAFSTAALALRGLDLAAAGPRPSGDGVWRRSLPLAFCVAAVVYCYPELLPFLAPALALSYLWPWPADRAAWLRRAAAATSLAVLTVGLANLELGRSVHALRMQSQVVAGNPVAWSPAGFLAQSLGVRAGIYEGGTWIFEQGWHILWTGLPAVVVFALVLAWTGRRRHVPARGADRARTAGALLPALLMVAVCTAAFVYFRAFVPNPWPHGLGPWAAGVGQTWSQWKLSLWLSPALLAVLVGGWVGVARKRVASAWPWGQTLLALWCAAGLGWNSALMLARVNPIRLVSGETGDPFAAYRAVCEPLQELPPASLIFLDAKPGDFASIKQRELLAYFLGDHELLGDWTLDDNLPTKFLPPAERKLSSDAADWVVHYHQPTPGASANPATPVCGLTIVPASHGGWTLASVTGGYAREIDPAGGWFYWTARDLQFVWRRAADDPAAAVPAPPPRVKLGFSVHTFATEQTVTVRITGTAAGEQTFTVPATRENTHRESAPFVVPPGGEVQVTFSGTAPPVRASATDSRELSYLVGSAALVPVDD